MDKDNVVIKNLGGKNTVLIPDIRFRGKRKIYWKEVEQYLKQYVGSWYEVAETAEKIYIGSDFPDEYAGSEDTGKLMGALAKAKANAAQRIPELIHIAVNRSLSPNYEKKHERDAKYGWCRYDTQFALPVYGQAGNTERYNIYSARMLVRNAEDGKKYLYDLLRIKKEMSTPFEQ